MRHPTTPSSRPRSLLPSVACPGGGALLLWILLLGCGPEQAQNPLAAEEPFVAIARDVDAQTVAARRQALAGAGVADLREAGPGDDFYLAVHKKQLGQPWFLSAYMKQYFPGAVSYGAGRSLGTRVVTFRIQNGKLFVFDITRGKKTSDTFDPQLVIEAYPLITDYPPFERLPGSKNYVLIDPAAGRNRFSILIDGWYTNGQPDRFAIELSYLQRFRKLSDGVTYEQVFTGYSEKPDPASPQLGEPNQFRTSGTLGVALRRYAEGEGFVPYQPAATDPAYFFLDWPLQVPNTGTFEQYAVKWNVVYDPMARKLLSRPIEWVYSNHIDALKQDDRFKDYDIEGAIRAGITAWNEAFGFEVLRARKARPGESYADDDVNYVIFDEDPSFGAAFANWRTNPNTGEIRGASVYFSSLWLEVGDQIFADDMGRSGPVRPRQRPRVPLLFWDPMGRPEPCTLWPLPYRLSSDEDHDAVLRLPEAGPSQLTKRQKIERYVTHVIAHEIGHTLGLRHNFKGSLAYGGDRMANSSSVMEYIDDQDAVYATRPGPYDVQAIRLLYGLSTVKPTAPFCTDGQTRTDPDCAPYDRRANPLTEFHGPFYDQVTNDFLEGRSTTAPNNAINRVAQYVRAGATPAVRMAAWDRLIAPVRVPIAPARLMIPGLGARADFVARRILSRLYLDAPNLRGTFQADPPATDPALQAAIVAELRGNLLNLDGVRSFPTRRVAVDILKKLQSSAAHAVLREARDALAMALPGLMGEARAQSEDLLARIDRALSPYFLN
ncbi:MAG: zinc-dependent metalloprotease [Myxococcales bacterium]|nr:zinc-dependent metalloprotease [Myxococcota bacterium]MDW8283529.1 zinc-dependent metalloprotease [Myxococcales bacterium]